jgi:hypothetical protein
MLQETKKEEVDRNYNNFHTCAGWNCILNKEQVDYLLQNRPDFIFCHGHGRNLKVDAITHDSYKVYTIPC